MLRRVLLLNALLLPLGTESLLAAEPAVSATWVDAKGQVVDQVSGVAAQQGIEWTVVGDRPERSTPALKVRIGAHLPPGAKLTAAGSADTQLVRFEPAPVPGEPAVLTVLTTRSDPVLHVEVKTASGSEPRSLILKITPEATKLVPMGPCAEGLAVTTSGSGAALFLGYSCTVSSTGLALQFVGSRDGSWGRAQVPGGEPHAGDTVAQITATDSADHESTYVFRWPGGVKAASPFHARAGVGTTYVSYSEVLSQVNESQLGLTGKAGVAYVPSRLSIDASAFATLTDLLVSPSSLPGARYLGLNGRAGYRIPPRPLDLDIAIYAGWYFWTMSVSSDRYGISYLAGPQLFAQAARRLASGTPLSGYLKLAFVSAGSRLVSVGNEEVAAGISVGLSAAALPWSVTLDVSHIQFSADGNSMSSSSVSAGVSKGFF
jgi:hypothetical protein